MSWRDDDDGPMISALAELSERCTELEQRVSMLEDEEWDDDDEEEGRIAGECCETECSGSDEGDSAEADYLGDISDEEDDEPLNREACEREIAKSPYQDPAKVLGMSTKEIDRAATAALDDMGIRSGGAE